MRFGIPATTEFPQEQLTFHGKTPKVLSNHPPSYPYIWLGFISNFDSSRLPINVKKKETRQGLSFFSRFDQIVWPSLFARSILTPLGHSNPRVSN